MKRNATVSPLLRLPSEIRNRIYGFVFGVHRLYIDYNPHEHNYKIIEGRREKIHVPGGLYHFAGVGLDEKICIGLLRVCRQTHEEAALLPYTLNTFYFANSWVHRRFGKESKPVQKRAIRNWWYMSTATSLRVQESRRAHLAKSWSRTLESNESRSRAPEVDESLSKARKRERWILAKALEVDESRSRARKRERWMSAEGSEVKESRSRAPELDEPPRARKWEQWMAAEEFGFLT